jgi:hypothetical protein
MFYTNDPINDFANHCADQERELLKRPVCVCCSERIADEYCYEINGELICFDCVENHFKIETPIDGE